MFYPECFVSAILRPDIYDFKTKKLPFKKKDASFSGKGRHVFPKRSAYLGENMPTFLPKSTIFRNKGTVSGKERMNIYRKKAAKCRQECFFRRKKRVNPD